MWAEMRSFSPGRNLLLGPSGHVSAADMGPEKHCAVIPHLFEALIGLFTRYLSRVSSSLERVTLNVDS